MDYWTYYWKTLMDNKIIDFDQDSYLDDYEEIIKKVPKKVGLDLGCGIGQDTKWLKRHDFDVISTDICPDALDVLVKKGINEHVQILDLKEPFSFLNDEFGIVNANLSLHYFDYKTTINIFKEINRVLCQDGILIGRVNSNKNIAFKKTIVNEIEENYYLDIDNKYMRMFDEKIIKDLIKGWEVILVKEEVITRLNKDKHVWIFILKKR